MFYAESCKAPLIPAFVFNESAVCVFGLFINTLNWQSQEPISYTPLRFPINFPSLQLMRELLLAIQNDHKRRITSHYEMPLRELSSGFLKNFFYFFFMLFVCSVVCWLIEMNNLIQPKFQADERNFHLCNERR